MIGKKELKEILHNRFKDDSCKKAGDIPLPSELKDNYKAAKRIKKAVEAKENIIIVGDYDVDGIVSSVILTHFLQRVGAKFDVKIPNRFTEGYGLNSTIIDNLPANTNLIITVDNGISADEAAICCQKRGIELIITDHHQPPSKLPIAFAIINPKQQECHFPNSEICGAQVAWYLVGALKDVFGINYDMSKSLDILLLAIIADMMELRDMNRVLTRLGLEHLNRSKRACFRAIREYYGKSKFGFDDISFLIAPLINSTGRMDDATLSYKFLSSTDIRKANGYLDEIISINNSRKEEEKNLYEDSILNVDEDDSIIVAWGKEWHEGVIGIVASRLCKQYKKPAIVFSIDDDRAKGSARSVGRFDILKAIEDNRELLIGYGGHRSAAGIVIDPSNLMKFKEALNSQISKEDIIASTNYKDEILGELNLDELDLEMLDILEFFEPYGQKNPRPTFILKDLKVLLIRTIGKDQNHLKMTLKKGGTIKEALFFNFDVRPKENDYITIIATITKNEFKKMISPELIIKEIVSH